ncbi:hypothetical protein C0Z18_12820 [Trinickia dabaoshanensis]|uniref:DUF2933 domain-containing protein n=1 Tax=Trinickia dabaoshanensis TaxID=564714 RepID=A0A2N7VRD4_9BURK|nr:DUF2933 domain-containing protein [Trinickia dabaoshanensis]PMS19718.1 hypothetical protein C0Z18_12820 [Trinickia dabaoshanensis]TAM51846.1 MAG: DUF2933 domain-containing protein [Paraburkholderia sp.]
MKCTKTMLVTGAAVLAVLAGAYFALPQFRALIVSAGPYLLFLLCPLSMLFMMKSMNSHSDRRSSSDDSENGRQPSNESHLKR